jgi:uncharacterized protein (TIGR04255 family)
MSAPSNVGQQRGVADPPDPTLFGNWPRVVYDRNPLEVVICQLSFPAILRIASEEPAEFQEQLREAYPNFKEISPTPFPENVGPIVSWTLPSTFKAYEFSSETGEWQVTLTRESLALTCKKYSRWEDFRHRLQVGVAALLQVYRPPFYTRVGLRYQNVINRAELGLSGIPWSDLLSRSLAGEFHSPLENSIEAAKHIIILGIPGGPARVTLQHGLATRGTDKEICYIIDNDFSILERTGVDDATRTLDYFNRQSGKLFRWCITERLHLAMGPQPIHAI